MKTAIHFQSRNVCVQFYQENGKIRRWEIEANNWPNRMVIYTSKNSWKTNVVIL